LNNFDFPNVLHVFVVPEKGNTLIPVNLNMKTSASSNKDQSGTSFVPVFFQPVNRYQ